VTIKTKNPIRTSQRADSAALGASSFETQICHARIARGRAAALAVTHSEREVR
jgi:hypothetical protein